MQIDDRDRLQGMFAPPAKPAAEPIANFPLRWYEEFLNLIVRRNIQIITYQDLFGESDDWEYVSNYSREFGAWKEQVRDPQQRYLLLQHDVDDVPEFTKRMVAMEAFYGIRSNVFMFRDRYLQGIACPPYKVDELGAVAFPIGSDAAPSASCRIESNVASPLWGDSRSSIPKPATEAANR